MSRQTPFDLGEHFEAFVAAQVASGRYANAEEVLRSGLRLLEEHERREAILRDALATGEASGVEGPLDMERLKRQAREERGRDAV